MIRYFIDDIGISDNYRERLQVFGEIVLGRHMAQKIQLWDGWDKFHPSTSLLVFPGNGASIARGFFSEQWLSKWRLSSVHAKRIWAPGEPPCAIVSRIYPNGFLLNIRDIVIVDDVVSSGVTARKLRQVNAPWIPAAQWHVVCWMSQRAANVRGFVSMYSAVEVGDSNRKAPINSLSTLLKEVEIAESYARRNFLNPEAFLKLLQELR